MFLTKVGNPGVGASTSGILLRTLKRAEYNLESSFRWGEWMKAADESQEGRESSAHLLTAESGDCWTE